MNFKKYGHILHVYFGMFGGKIPARDFHPPSITGCWELGQGCMALCGRTSEPTEGIWLSLFQKAIDELHLLVTIFPYIPLSYVLLY